MKQCTFQKQKTVLRTPGRGTRGLASRVEGPSGESDREPADGGWEGKSDREGGRKSGRAVAGASAFEHESEGLVCVRENGVRPGTTCMCV